MSDIALYEAKEVATKADFKDMLTKTDLKIGLAEFETRLVKHLYAVTGIIIAAVGVMITAAGLITKIF